MIRRGLSLLLVFVAAGVSPPADDPVAARLGGREIRLSEVDAATGGKAERLLGRLRAEARQALERIVDGHLVEAAGGLPRADTPPVDEDRIDAFRAERAADFEGPAAPGGSARDPAVQRAAIRHYLEERDRARARQEVLAGLRARHRIERRLPPARELARPLSPDRIVALVDGAPVRAAALESEAALALYRLRGELARVRRRAAERLVEERLLAREAERRGLSVDALIAGGTPPVTDADVAAHVAAERAAGRPPPDPDRVRPYLAFRARHAARERLLGTLREREAARVLVSEPEPPVLAVEVGDAPSLGPPGGAVLVAFSNYRCRVCRATHGEIDRLLAASDDVRVVFRDWIPHYDPGAREAAALARCAHRAGRFAAMRRALLAADPPEFGRGYGERLDRLAASAGMDAASLRRCLSGDVVRVVEADVRRARDLGFETAPAFVAEGLPLTGAQSAEGLGRAIRDGSARR